MTRNNLERPLQAHEISPLNRGVITVILRPTFDEKGVFSGEYVFYCLEQKGYCHNGRDVKGGLGLLSESFEPGEYDPVGVLARSYVEEVCGISHESVGDDLFNEKVEEIFESKVSQLIYIGEFEYAFNYLVIDPDVYTSRPNTLANVLVMIDDECVFPVEGVRTEEIDSIVLAGREDVKQWQSRSGYNIHHLLGIDELQRILDENNIQIAGTYCHQIITTTE